MRVGIDTVDIQRFRAIATRYPRMLDRLFTANEQRTLEQRMDPIPGFAARFAAKESAIKAIGVLPAGWSWHDIEVIGGAGAPVELRLHNQMLLAARNQGMAESAVSLSHDTTHAVAVVMSTG